MEKLKFLSSVPIFSDLSSSTLQKVSDLGGVKSYPKNSVIFSEEEDGSALFVIISGKVKVCRTSKEDTSKEVIFSILNPSDFFGEMALLDGLNRSASVIAMEDSQLFLIQRSDFLELLHEYPEVSIALLQARQHTLVLMPYSTITCFKHEGKGVVA